MSASQFAVADQTAIGRGYDHQPEARYTPLVKHLRGVGACVLTLAYNVLDGLHGRFRKTVSLGVVGRG